MSDNRKDIEITVKFTLKNVPIDKVSLPARFATDNRLPKALHALDTFANNGVIAKVFKAKLNRVLRSGSHGNPLFGPIDTSFEMIHMKIMESKHE